jgi:hypothetical protein
VDTINATGDIKSMGSVKLDLLLADTESQAEVLFLLPVLAASTGP